MSKRFSLARQLGVATVAGWLAVWPAFGLASSPASSSAASPSCPPLLQHTLLRLQDEKPQSLCQYTGKVLLVVNTASACGFTPQYAGLEALHARYQDQGLVVLGFPSNDFAQERGSNKDIADFCQNTYGVKFPMFTKTSVTGRDAHPFYKMLASEAGSGPRWNFHKFLIGRDGKTVSAHGSTTSPQDTRFVRQIEQLLAK